MFLRPLNCEQKKLFLNLATAAANANHVMEESEKALLEAYADEMDIRVDDAENCSIEEICARLKDISSLKERNQIVFEIVGMVVSDNQYDDHEKAFIGKMAQIFGIPMERIDQMFHCVNEYSALLRRINILMFE